MNLSFPVVTKTVSCIFFNIKGLKRWRIKIIFLENEQNITKNVFMKVKCQMCYLDFMNTAQFLNRVSLSFQIWIYFMSWLKWSVKYVIFNSWTWLNFWIGFSSNFLNSGLFYPSLLSSFMFLFIYRDTVLLIMQKI